MGEWISSCQSCRLRQIYKGLHRKDTDVCFNSTIHSNSVCELFTLSKRSFSNEEDLIQFPYTSNLTPCVLGPVYIRFFQILIPCNNVDVSFRVFLKKNVLAQYMQKQQNALETLWNSAGHTLATMYLKFYWHLYMGINVDMISWIDVFS